MKTSYSFCVYILLGLDISLLESFKTFPTSQKFLRNPDFCRNKFRKQSHCEMQPFVDIYQTFDIDTMISVLQNSLDIVNIDVLAITTNIAAISAAHAIEPSAIAPLLAALSTEVPTISISSLETSPVYALAQTPVLSIITSITTPIVSLIQTPVDSLLSTLITAKTIDINAIFTKAFTTGKAGASAAGIQVITLMWLRTALNYQYRYGTGTMEALNTLWKEGGIKRLYQGLPFALVQGPLSRFGDTASNALVITLLEVLDPLDTIPVFLRTGAYASNI
jgi:hypothetical protein